MFLKISKEDVGWSRSKKALPVFFLLWLGGVFLALLYLFSVRVHLQALEIAETEELLDAYLVLHQSPGNSFGTVHLRGFSSLQGLTFVRIIQGEDQVFLVDEKAGVHGLQGLVGLGSEAAGIWMRVEIDGKEQFLTIITKDYKSGISIQAGKESNGGYFLYQRLIRNTFFIVLGSCLVLWPVALLFIKLSLSPLITTKERIADLVNRSSNGILPESGNGPELDNLYIQINRLLRHNRHLVFEMQNSLDNVAHDLRTPMTRLRSVAEYGLQAEDDPERLKEVLSDCLEESERVLAMLNIMMSVAEAESGTMRLEREDCDLVASLRQVVLLYEYIAEERNIDVVLEGEQSLMISCDATRISQVWANLLDNAIKYGRDGGWVKIAAGQTDQVLTVSITDNGMGISENEQDRIWERLYRGDRSRSQQGLGLGLNYVKAVVEAHGGVISVVSALHEGSCFTVAFPKKTGVLLL